MRLRGALLLVLGVSLPTHAIGTLQIDETRSLSIGLGLRGSVSESSPWGEPALGDELAVLGISGVATPWLHLQANFIALPSGVQALDAIVMLEPAQVLKLWAGHLLPPGDRTNFSGPFFVSTWDLPFVSRYPGQLGGRDDGAVAWGEVLGGAFKYQAGVFAGRRGSTSSNPTGVPLFAGRVVVNLLDPEPGYYDMSTYFGSKEVLSLGVGARYQRHGAGVFADDGAYGAYDLDVLWEKRLAGWGTLTLEGALYRYDTGGVRDPLLVQGNAGMALAGYLLPRRVGPGQLQGVVRYQALRPDAGGTHQRYDVGINYALAGPFIRFGGFYSAEQLTPAAAWTHGFKLGTELVL